MQTEIYNSLFDPSKLASSSQQRWNIGTEAKIVSSTQTLGDPRIARISQLPENYQAVIGGLCSIFTGDLKEKLTDPQAAKIIRLDQIIEAVGTIPGKPSFIIIEDSYFEILTGINQNQFQKQGVEAANRIERWLKLTNPQMTDLFFAFTSNVQLDKGIKDLVGYFSNDVIQNPNFGKITVAPVLLMYTGFWPKLLNSLGLIPSDQVVCIEPVNHFVDDRNLPDNLVTAYWEFLDWLKTNPYGTIQSANANMGIAGFQESIAIDGTQKRSRLLPFQSVPNTQNYSDWFSKIYNNIYDFPFPLKNNPIFISGVNWGILDPRINQLLCELSKSESSYYERRNETPKSSRTQEWAKSLKDYFQNKNESVLEKVYLNTKQIVEAVLK